MEELEFSNRFLGDYVIRGMKSSLSFVLFATEENTAIGVRLP